MKSRLFLIMIAVVLLWSCNNSPETGSFDIYILNDSELSITEFDNASIQDIDLPFNPTLTISDIQKYTIYDYNGLSLSHTVSINNDVKSLLGNTNSIFFVLVVNGERKYKGEYWANFMDTYPLDVTLWASRDSAFTIMARDSGNDKINDPEIINTLSNYGIEVLYYPLY